MTRLLITLAVNVGGLMLADALLDGVAISSFGYAVLAGLILGAVNWLVRPVLTVLALPVIIVTFGLAMFLVNLVAVALAAWLTPEFTIDGFWPAAATVVALWVVNVVVQAVARR